MLQTVKNQTKTELWAEQRNASNCDWEVIFHIKESCHLFTCIWTTWFYIVVCLAYSFPQRAFPYISVMLGNGTLSYDHDQDGRSTELGGCTALVRNTVHDTFLLIRYSNNRFTVRRRQPSGLKLYSNICIRTTLTSTLTYSTSSSWWMSMVSRNGKSVLTSQDCGYLQATSSVHPLPLGTCQVWIIWRLLDHRGPLFNSFKRNFERRRLGFHPRSQVIWTLKE